MSDRIPLIVVGSSVRAAAQSAARSGFEPWCVDQFGDLDLQEIAAKVRIVPDWPEGIEEALSGFPDAEWIYTGALENSPSLVQRLTERRRLLGCGPDVLKRVRNPEWIVTTLSQASLPSLPVIMPAAGLAEALANDKHGDQNNWILKPLASAAGIGIRPFETGSLSESEAARCYLQKRATGRAVSGLYLASNSSAQLLGLCEQLCGSPDAGTGGLIYCGSLGPLSPEDFSRQRNDPLARRDPQRSGSRDSWRLPADTSPLSSDSAHPMSTFYQAHQIGAAIAERAAVEGAALKGLFGIDFIFGDGHLWTLEINPRYTASAELYERAFNWPLLRWHVEACRDGNDTSSALPKPSFENSTWRKYGKLIVYAPQDLVAPDIPRLMRRLNLPAFANLTFADIPQPGTMILRNQPVCTLFAENSQIDQCHDMLMSGAVALRESFANIGDYTASGHR